MKAFISITAIAILLISCEDVIDIELDSVPPQMVIEGVIDDLDPQCQIKISKTCDYFKPGENPIVSGAIVTVTDDLGFVTEFEETAPGTFTSVCLTGTENTSYTLEVRAEEESYMASCTFPQKVDIDSLTFELPSLLFDFEDGYMVTCYFQDPVDVLNYYRLKAYKKGEEGLDDPGKFIFNDDFMDGNTIIMPWDYTEFFPMDTVVVELQTLDRATYDYYRTLFPILGGGMGASNPANPESNISNDALGYFGAYTVSRDTIVIQTL